MRCRVVQHELERPHSSLSEAPTDEDHNYFAEWEIGTESQAC